MSSHHQITNIHEGQSFSPNVDYGEYFSCLTQEVGEWKDKALKALKASAKAMIPENEMKNVIFDSIASYGRTVFMWRWGRNWWVNLHGNNAQVYEL